MVGVLVLGVHFVGVLVWWTLGRDLPLVRSGGESAPLTVWLPPLRLPILVPVKRATLTESHHAERPRSGTDANPGPVNDSAAQSSADEVAVEAPPASSSALNLHLPRKALTTPTPPSAAALSPFHGRLPATVEQIIANAAAETGSWIEERIDNDHIRLRRGNTCVLMERLEAAAVDPFSDAARRMPWRASVSRC